MIQYQLMHLGKGRTSHRIRHATISNVLASGKLSSTGDRSPDVVVIVAELVGAWQNSVGDTSYRS